MPRMQRCWAWPHQPRRPPEPHPPPRQEAPCQPTTRSTTSTSLLDTPISRRRALQIAAAAGAAAFLGGTTAARVTAQEAEPVTGRLPDGDLAGLHRLGRGRLLAVARQVPDRHRASPSTTRRPSTATRSSSPPSCRVRCRTACRTGWDLVVLTDEMSQRLVNYGWLEPIDAAAPNYPANLLDIYTDPGVGPRQPLRRAVRVGHDRSRLRPGRHRARSPTSTSCSHRTTRAASPI